MLKISKGYADQNQCLIRNICIQLISSRHSDQQLSAGGGTMTRKLGDTYHYYQRCYENRFKYL